MDKWKDISYDIPDEAAEILGSRTPYTVLETEYSYIEINLEDNTESPREWSNLGHMICFHNRYDLGDKHEEWYQKDSYQFRDWFAERMKARDIVWQPLYLYDHSGISMSCSLTYPYNDVWDAGQVGIIYATLEDIRKEFNVKRVTPKMRLKTLIRLTSEVTVYDQFLRGDIYWYVQYCKDCGEVMDTCGGFYGDNWNENGIMDHISWKRCEYCLNVEEQAWKEALEMSGE